MRKISMLITVLTASCSDGSNVVVPLPASDTALCVALGVDYTNGVGTMAVIGLPSLTVLKEMVPAAISGDPVLRAFGKRLYVINRSANNVTVIDPTAQPWLVESQFSTGANSNPQDIALAGDRAYISLYNKAEIQVWDLAAPNPAAPIATVDLSALDEDGVPNANSIVITGGRAYVTLDLLDTQMFPKPRGRGKVAVIDTGENRLVATLELKYSNPYDFMFQRGETLVVSTFDNFSGFTGCLEQIALGSTPRVDSCLVENQELSGIVNSIAVGPTDTFFAVSAFGPPPDFDSTGQLRRLDASGDLVPGSLTPDSQIPSDVAHASSGHLVYADQAGGGLRVYDLAAGHELTTEPLNIGLAPAFANAIVCVDR